MREKLEKQADAAGMEAMLQLLASVDPDSAAKLHPADRKRVIRALEVYYETGETITAHNLRTQAIAPRYSPVWLGLDFEDRAELYRRIDLRVDIMLKDGLIDEIEALLASGISPKCTAMQAIGYKEFVSAITENGSIPLAAEEVKKGSRHYAKRQLTWFRRNPKMHWLARRTGETADEILAAARQVLREFDK